MSANAAQEYIGRLRGGSQLYGQAVLEYLMKRRGKRPNPKRYGVENRQLAQQVVKGVRQLYFDGRR